MIKGGDSSGQDPHVIEVASSLVNDVIEKAREEVLKRKSVSHQTAEAEPTPLRRLSQWQNRAQGAFRRFLTSICVRIQEMTKFMPQYLNILLKKNDLSLSWGFEAVGGRDKGFPLTIYEVHSNSFGSQYLSDGDEIVRINGIDTAALSEAEAVTFIKRSATVLDLVILKNPICSYSNQEQTEESKFQCYYDEAEKRKPKLYKRSLSVPPKCIALVPEDRCELILKYPNDSKTRRKTDRIKFEKNSRRKSDSVEKFDQKWQIENVDAELERNAFSDVLNKFEKECLENSKRSRAWNEKGSRCRSLSKEREWKQKTEKPYPENVLERSRSVVREWINANKKLDNNDNVLNFEVNMSDTTSGYSTECSHQNFSNDSIDNITKIDINFDWSSRRNKSSVYVNREDHDGSFQYTARGTAVGSLPYIGNEKYVSQKAIRRQSSQIKGSQPSADVSDSSGSCSHVSAKQNGNSAPPAPPPPPPPSLNGTSIPAIRLKSEISGRTEPPASIQNAMMTKDKKPFTYLPGGIDLSEIKSPRMQRRIARNAQTPDDIVLPTSTHVDTNSLPPSAVAAMTPHLSIPVLPQNCPQKAPPPPPLPKNASDDAKHITKVPITGRSNVGSLYIPPVTVGQNQNSPPMPVLREAPTPWLQKQQQQSEKPMWAKNQRQMEAAPKLEVRQQEVQKPNYQAGASRVVPIRTERDDQDSSNSTRIIPIQIDNSDRESQQPQNKQHSQRWGNNNINSSVTSRGSPQQNKADPQEGSKPIQSRSFKVIQQITGKENGTEDSSPYSSEGVPLSELRKLQLNDDDRAFMNRVKSQVDEDNYLHTETDPRYRGSVIPSRAFRMLQNMTDSGQVVQNPQETRNQERCTTDPKPEVIKQQRAYIPPSERPAEQDLRKYTGSSIPSRSFKMLQAITSTQNASEKERMCADIDGRNSSSAISCLSPIPWSSPPKSTDEVVLFWKHYNYLYDLVTEHMPHFLDSSSRSRTQSIRNTDSEFSDSTAFNTDSESAEYFPSKSSLIIDFNRLLDDKGDKLNSNMLSKEGAENSNNTESPREELIITEIIKDRSENDISVTICIPFKKKRQSKVYDEFYEEITISNVSDSEKKADVENTCTLDLAQLNSSRSQINSVSQKISPASSVKSSTSSSSIDFWQELSTNDEDIFYKPSLKIYEYTETENSVDSGNRTAVSKNLHSENHIDMRSGSSTNTVAEKSENIYAGCRFSDVNRDSQKAESFRFHQEQEKVTELDNLSKNASPNKERDIQNAKETQKSTLLTKKVTNLTTKHSSVEDEMKNIDLKCIEYIENNKNTESVYMSHDELKNTDFKCNEYIENNKNTENVHIGHDELENNDFTYNEYIKNNKNIENIHIGHDEFENTNFKCNKYLESTKNIGNVPMSHDKLENNDFTYNEYIENNKSIENVQMDHDELENNDFTYNENIKNNKNIGNIHIGHDEFENTDFKCNKYLESTKNNGNVHMSHDKLENNDFTYNEYIENNKNIENVQMDHDELENTNFKCNKYLESTKNIGNVHMSHDKLENNDFTCNEYIENNKNIENVQMDHDELENTNFKCNKYLESTKNIGNVHMSHDKLENNDFTCNEYIENNKNIENVQMDHDELENTNFKCNKYLESTKNIGNVHMSHDKLENNDFTCNEYIENNKNIENVQMDHDELENTDFKCNTKNIGNVHMSHDKLENTVFKCSNKNSESIHTSHKFDTENQENGTNENNTRSKLENDDTASRSNSKHYCDTRNESNSDINQFIESSNPKNMLISDLRDGQDSKGLKKKVSEQDFENLRINVSQVCPYTFISSSSNSSSDINEDSESNEEDSSADSYNVYEFTTFRTNKDEESVTLQAENVNKTEDTFSDIAAEERTLLGIDVNDQYASGKEDDSGVTSDIGKFGLPYTCGSELRKLTKYQRAATHSRLYKLLKQENHSENVDVSVRKESLSLPLRNQFFSESVSSSSGVNSPLSPVVNEKLVDELVDSLLKWENGAEFRNIPPEKLRRIALQSLQVESSSDTSRNNSPHLNVKHNQETMSQPEPDENSLYYPGFDVLPSKAFKNLTSGRFTPNNWPKCPLISETIPQSRNS